MINIFNDSAIQTINNTLDEVCVGGECISSADLCAKIGLDADEYRPIMSFLIKNGFLPKYKIYLGPGRGIGHKDTPPIKKSQDGTVVTIDKDLKDALHNLLDNRPIGRSAISRKDIVTEISPYCKNKVTPQLVSEALKLDEFSNFSSRKGKDGGVFRTAAGPISANIISSLVESEPEDLVASA